MAKLTLTRHLRQPLGKKWMVTGRVTVGAAQVNDFVAKEDLQLSQIDHVVGVSSVNTQTTPLVVPNAAAATESEGDSRGDLHIFSTGGMICDFTVIGK